MYPEKATPLIQLLTKELHIMSVWCDGKGLNWVPVSTDSFSTHAADAARPVVESNLGFAKETFLWLIKNNSPSLLYNKEKTNVCLLFQSPWRTLHAPTLSYYQSMLQPRYV